MNALKKLACGLTASALIAPLAQAAELTVEIENLTRGIYFTPLSVAAHDDSTSLFELGASASAEVQAMAEGGSITGIETIMTTAGATQSNNPADGLLLPGASTSTMLDTDGTSNTRLTITAMMLPTNDGFIALNAMEIPSEAGTYTYYLKAYDAGTEANNEIVGSGTPGEAGYPAPAPVLNASGSNGTGVPASMEGYIHVHRGVLGDTDAMGGLSDIDSTMHRWLNPVAKVTLTVAE